MITRADVDAWERVNAEPQTPTQCQVVGCTSYVSDLRMLGYCQTCYIVATFHSYAGSRFVEAGPVLIGTMSLEARDALDLAMARWGVNLQKMQASGFEPTDIVYSFAYWLFRWSGIVTGVNLDAPENPWHNQVDSNV